MPFWKKKEKTTRNERWEIALDATKHITSMQRQLSDLTSKARVVTGSIANKDPKQTAKHEKSLKDAVTKLKKQMAKEQEKLDSIFKEDPKLKTKLYEYLASVEARHKLVKALGSIIRRKKDVPALVNFWESSEQLQDVLGRMQVTNNEAAAEILLRLQLSLKFLTAAKVHFFKSTQASNETILSYNKHKTDSRLAKVQSTLHECERCVKELLDHAKAFSKNADIAKQVFPEVEEEFDAIKTAAVAAIPAIEHILKDIKDKKEQVSMTQTKPTTHLDQIDEDDDLYEAMFGSKEKSGLSNFFKIEGSELEPEEEEVFEKPTIKPRTSSDSTVSGSPPKEQPTRPRGKSH